MRLYYEWAIRQLKKRGEELCGDNVSVSRHTDSVTLAISDGLGSGVKANILSTLTTRIAMKMLENDLPLTEVVETLGKTLPVCQVRNLAYSTFAIAQFFRNGYARLVEFDAPPTIQLRKRKLVPMERAEKIIGGRKFTEGILSVELGDWIIFVSDGVLNAGIGGRYALGWGWEQAVKFLEERAHPGMSSQDLADLLADTVDELYAGKPGDDVSVVVIKVRHKLSASLLTGPPRDKGADAQVVEKFMKRAGPKIICGGSTAKIVSRHLGEPLEVDLATMGRNVPPLGRMKSVNLVTEGILTLTRAAEMLKAGARKDTVRFHVDGAAALVRMLLDVDHVHFIVGMAVNPAHQNPDLPVMVGIKLAVVRELADQLTRRGIETDIETV